MKYLTESQPAPGHAPDAVAWLRWAGAVGVLSVLALSAPFIWQAVAAGVGLMLLAAGAAVGLVLIHSMPWLLQRLENRLLKARKSEARSNPIEQLQHDCLRRSDRLGAFRAALVEIGAQIESMRDMLAERRQIDPQHVLVRQTQALDRMVQFHDANVQRLAQAYQALQTFQLQVEQKTFEWSFAQAGQVVMDSLRPAERDELMHNLLTDEALRSVQDQFNAVFAELDLQLRAVDAPTRSLLPAELGERSRPLGLASWPQGGRLR